MPCSDSGVFRDRITRETHTSEPTDPGSLHSSAWPAGDWLLHDCSTAGTETRRIHRRRESRSPLWKHQLLSPVASNHRHTTPSGPLLPSDEAVLAGYRKRLHGGAKQKLPARYPSERARSHAACMAKPHLAAHHQLRHVSPHTCHLPRRLWSRNRTRHRTPRIGHRAPC